MTVTEDEPWRIAAAMLNFPPSHEADEAVWRDALGQVARAGFSDVDPMDSWVRLADLEPARLDALLGICSDLGLRIPAISTSRRSVVDPAHGEENLAYSHRVIDTAAAIGATAISFGLMQALTPRQREALWFWTVPGASDPDDREVRRLAASRFRDLGDHALSVGVVLSLEMYEDTYLGTTDSAIRLIEEIDSPAVGLNPDLGNLVRRQGPVEPWYDIITRTAPYVTYWHVKSYARLEDPIKDVVLSTPTAMELGVIDYRTAVSTVLAAGYRGHFCAESYGGDGLSISARNRDYLRTLLPSQG